MRSSTTSWVERVELWLRGLTPVVLTAIMVFASAIPWQLPAFAPVTPAFVVMAVFYWSIYRPDKLPYAATFLLGVFYDLLTGAPVGLTALVLLIVQSLVSAQRTFFHGKPFLVVWWGFSLVMPGAGLLSWIVGSAYLDGLLPILPVVVQVVLTVLLYPAFSVLFGRIQHHLMARV